MAGEDASQAEASGETARPKDPIERLLEGRFETGLFLFRHTLLVPVVFSALGAVLMITVGVFETVQAVEALVVADFEGVTLPLIKSLDAFLIGVVLTIFALGLYDFFISELDPNIHGGFRNDWVKFDDVGRFKHKIVEVVLVVLGILFFELMRVNFEHFDTFLEYLAIPIGTAILALAFGGFRQLTHN